MSAAWGRDEERARDATIEAAISARRERDAEGRIVPPPAWWDLAPDGREELYRLQLVTRVMEKAMSGASGTVRAVMARIEGA